MNQESMNQKGSCLCGGVRYTVEVPLTQIALCHCRMCRKASGTAFAANAPVPRAAFRVDEGEALLARYASSPGKERVFCSRCGSPVYSVNARKPDLLRIRVGLLDTPVTHRPDFHFMTAHKAEWYAITDALPQYPEYEVGR